MARNYDGFQTQAFNAGIPNELMLTVKDWVETHHTVKGGGRSVSPTDNIGYAELADITTVEQAFDKIKQHILMATLYETPAKTKRAKKKFYKDAGGRVGKGVYRIALKGYYLSRGSA